MRKSKFSKKSTKTKKSLKGVKKPKSVKEPPKKKKSKYKLLDNLNPLKVPKVRREIIDADYLNKLDDKTLEWYAKFISEYAGGAVKKSKKTNRPLSRHLHRSNKLAKDVYDANNRRNNDMYGVAKANGLINSDSPWSSEEINSLNPGLTEESLIAKIDNENNDILSLEEFMELKDQLTSEMVSFYKKHYNLK